MIIIRNTIRRTMKFHTMFLLTMILHVTQTSSLPNFSVAKPECISHCGDSISIPYPFGTNENCYREYEFWVTCNETFNPPKLFIQNTTIEITKISLDGQITLLQYIANDCYSQNGSQIDHFDPSIDLQIYFTVNITANKFTILGCDTLGIISGRRNDRNYFTGCTSTCGAKEDLVEGPCGGLGCCQITSIPRDVWRVDISLATMSNYTNISDFNNCGYAFLAEESAFTYHPDNLTNLRDINKLPMVADWAIGNGTCMEAKINSSSYACISPYSECYKPEDNGYGYRCRCIDGYQGNPYIEHGCQDIDECSSSLRLHNCTKQSMCQNFDGGFSCKCPSGYHGKGEGENGCTMIQRVVFKIVAGIAVGIILLLVVYFFLYMEFKRRRSKEMKQKYFLQNGGLLLQEKLIQRERSPNNMAKIYNTSELEKATNNFNSNMIVGQGGYGTVYKGSLEDNTIVAVKKSKEVDHTQIEQFINEIFVLCHINHRNVVKLLGCCLETSSPLLVYEFVSNGTLFDHIHNEKKKISLNWDMRLKIAIETANVLAYLHSAASIPIIHRDVKSANILLDDEFAAKVSDFGASRLVPLDQTQLSTMVQGTFGYLDPEYMQTNQLTEKSDVYSFGVVLIELLTSKKVLCYERREEDKNLANFFLRMLKQNRVHEILDENIAREENKEQLVEVARLAQGCLNVRGEDRPSMKEVAKELEGMKVTGKHSWVKNKENVEEMESLLGEGLSGFDGYSAMIEFDSLKTPIAPQMRGGR